MKRRFIDEFEVILLDMGNTFMFNVDRFGKNDDLGATYKKLGGNELQADEVYAITSSIFNQMITDSQIPDNYHNFQKVSDYIKTHPLSSGLSAEEKIIIEKVIAQHEIGVIPGRDVKLLEELAQTHRLGVISDIWSDSKPYFIMFQQAGIRELFDIILFSSDLGIIKPSPMIFKKAVDYFGLDVSKIVYVGDSLRRDIQGAKNSGISAIWINRESLTAKNISVNPDMVVTDLGEILGV